MTWRLPTRDFKYYDWEITEIEYDKPNIYHARAIPFNEALVSNRPADVPEKVPQ